MGRPRRGTEAARTDALIAAATRVFLRDGYGRASIDKVAYEAGVSTRTIYERFKNKGDLLAAVITRLVERDMETVLATDRTRSHGSAARTDDHRRDHHRARLRSGRRCAVSHRRHRGAALSGTRGENARQHQGAGGQRHCQLFPQSDSARQSRRCRIPTERRLCSRK